MKFNEKNKRVQKSSKPKRQPDHIQQKPIKLSGKLGSSQKKRVQSRVNKKFNKGKKNISSEENKDKTEDETSEQDLKQKDVEMEVQNDSDITKYNVNNPFQFNQDSEEDDDEDSVEKVDLIQNNGNNDSDEDESMEDLDENDNKGEDEESIDENVEDDDIVLNIQSGDNTINVTDLDSLNSRIQKFMDILINYKDYKAKNNETAQPRAYYVDIWINDLCDRFSYNKFLMVKLYQLFNSNLYSFLIASDEERPMTIRTNTLKTKRRELSETLTSKDCNVENLQFSKVGMVVHSSKCGIGSTSEYLAGHYILQGSSSMLPVMALAPKPGERILDMCAAPGGKSSHIAQIMKNTGCLYVNDNDKNRLKAVNGNLARMGVNNAVVSCHDGRSIHKKIRNCDRVLCDAPCTGTGVISKDRYIKASKDESDIKALTTLQKQLICAAVDSLKVGGFLVYSTCSVLIEENEQVVDYLCRKRNVKIMETGLFGAKGFVNFRSKSFNKFMDRTRRYYPHENNMDGFFVAKIQKLGNVPSTKAEKE